MKKWKNAKKTQPEESKWVKKWKNTKKTQPEESKRGKKPEKHGKNPVGGKQEG